MSDKQNPNETAQDSLFSGILDSDADLETDDGRAQEQGAEQHSLPRQLATLRRFRYPADPRLDEPDS
jgi:hypothetical protein